MQLEGRNLSFRYEKNKWLFQHMDVMVTPGEVVGITGPSGKGKTTLCKILAGFVEPVEGTVTIDGKPLSKSGFQPVQLVLQHPEKAVNPLWKMERVLNEGGPLDPELLDLLGIQKEWLSRWPNELSGGELQRFCVARALNPQTRFLIADEMTTMLDAITQAQIWHTVLEISRKRNMAVIVVSHDRGLIEKLCHRTIDFT